MKRTIAVFAVIAMLMSFIGIPVSAATTSVPTAKTRGTELITLPAGVEPLQPTAAASLDEALNVLGGTLEFQTMAMSDYGIYAWEVEGDYAKSTNAGQDGDPENPYGPMTQSQVSTDVYFEEGQGIRFRYKVSCQDEAETDFLALFVDYDMVGFWYGEVDWTTFTYPVSAGSHQVTWIYQKDASGSEGEDTAYLDDVEVVPCQAYTAVHSLELDEALNVEGGKLEFYTPEEASNGYYPWVAEDGYAKSTNTGVDATTFYSPPSISTVNTTVHAQEGQVLTFRYKVSSEEKMDLLRFYVDGERQAQWSGELDWAVYIMALEPGEHVLTWEYDKDWSDSRFEDTAWLDDVCVAAPVAATGIEIQETVSVPGYRSVALNWNVLPDTAFNREVSFASSDESIATVDENGIVTGISQGEATITVTTKDGGFTDTCLVTVTADEPPVNIYGFMFLEFVDKDAYFREPMTWCTFTDTHPEEVAQIGPMPAKDGVSEDSLVLCAELVGDTVYGYLSNGYYFTMDFEALQHGELDVAYKSVNVTSDENFYPTEMSYDYSTETMYVINDLGVLYEIDLETGDLDLDSPRVIDGILPGAPDRHRRKHLRRDQSGLQNRDQAHHYFNNAVMARSAVVAVVWAAVILFPALLARAAGAIDALTSVGKTIYTDLQIFRHPHHPQYHIGALSAIDRKAAALYARQYTDDGHPYRAGSAADLRFRLGRLRRGACFRDQRGHRIRPVPLAGYPKGRDPADRPLPSGCTGAAAHGL